MNKMTWIFQPGDEVFEGQVFPSGQKEGKWE